MIYQKGDLLSIKSLHGNKSFLNLWTGDGLSNAIVLNLPVTLILLESVNTEYLEIMSKSRDIKVLTFAGAGSICSNWLDITDRTNFITLLCSANNEQ